MPRKAIDYSKACIYKICCRDAEILDLYVGSTTDLVKRRYAHKLNCRDPNQQGHGYQVYNFIRENGGWDNWEVVQVESFKCSNSEDLCQREREVFDILKPSLNKNRPKVTSDEAAARRLATHKAWREANSETVRANTKAWNNKRVVCEHCHKEVAQGGLKKHQRTNKCLGSHDADL